MKDKLIKDIQKFLNGIFRYSDLLVFLDKQKDFLSQKNILEKTEDAEYNALWDTIIGLEEYFKYADSKNMSIGCEVSVLKVFNYNYEQRNKSSLK